MKVKIANCLFVANGLRVTSWPVDFDDFVFHVSAEDFGTGSLPFEFPWAFGSALPFAGFARYQTGWAAAPPPCPTP